MLTKSLSVNFKALDKCHVTRHTKTEPSVINLKIFLRLIFQVPDLALGLLCNFLWNVLYHISNNWLGLEFEKMKLRILSLAFLIGKRKKGWIQGEAGVSELINLVSSLDTRSSTLRYAQKEACFFLSFQLSAFNLSEC